MTLAFRRTDQLAQSVGVSGVAPTSLTSGGANTKGNYAQLIASTPYDSYGLELHFSHTSSTTRDRLVDIAIGGAGSEAVVIADVPLWSCGGPSTQTVRFPFFIPSGTRIAARFQATAATQTMMIWGKLLNGPIETCSHFTTLQANTADSGGLGIDPGGSAGTYSAYNQLIAAASLVSPVSKIWLFLGWRANGTPTSDTSWVVKLAAGASEVDIVTNELWHGGTAGNTPGQNPRCLDVNVPDGTRLSAAVACSITDATDRLVDVVAILGHNGRYG